MKKNDLALVLLIVSVSLVVAYLIGQTLLPPQKHSAQVEVVVPVTSDVTQPEKSTFHTGAINPAVPVNIGDSSNQQPF